jgi:hypothetical protein
MKIHDILLRDDQIDKEMDRRIKAKGQGKEVVVL